jgi:hypothetical protein
VNRWQSILRAAAPGSQQRQFGAVEMSYRPQFVMDPTPPGFEDEEFEYYFDSVNTPGLKPLSSGQAVYRVVLQLQNDAEFIWRAIQISGNLGPLQIRFYDPYGNELSAVTVEADRAYSAVEQGNAPIGRLPVTFEPEVRIPAGGFLMVDLMVL